MKDNQVFICFAAHKQSAADDVKQLVDQLAGPSQKATTPGERFAARLNLDIADRNFRDALAQAEKGTSTALDASARYGNLAQEWADDDEDVETFVTMPSVYMETFEVAGTIRWFDATRGYGLITPDNGLDDVLLHGTLLRSQGHSGAREGARIHCLVRFRFGLQAIRILALDHSSAVDVSTLFRQARLYPSLRGLWEPAVVKWFNRIRGFGFIEPLVGGPDVFCHMETLRRYGFNELRPGQSVQIRIGTGKKGWTVEEIRPDGVCDPPLTQET
jgi:cold shock protein